MTTSRKLTGAALAAPGSGLEVAVASLAVCAEAPIGAKPQARPKAMVSFVLRSKKMSPELREVDFYEL
jgi:hypothetical protein